MVVSAAAVVAAAAVPNAGSVGLGPRLVAVVGLVAVLGADLGSAREGREDRGRAVFAAVGEWAGVAGGASPAALVRDFRLVPASKDWMRWCDGRRLMILIA